MKEELFHENDKARFYKNDMTRDYGDGFQIILAEQKSNGRREYILTKDGEGVYASQQIETIWSHKDALDLANKLS